MVQKPHLSYLHASRAVSTLQLTASGIKSDKTQGSSSPGALLHHEVLAMRVDCRSKTGQLQLECGQSCTSQLENALMVSSQVE